MKRKNPTRSSTRGDHRVKKRILSSDVESPRSESATPAVPTESAPPEEEEEEKKDEGEKEPEKATLPVTLQAGQPLPTVETPQSDDVASRDYQSYKDSGVINESLTRSRSKWVTEGLFEKYWTKPVKVSKKKGSVVPDDPKNPSKDSMIKIGHVVLSIEPHTFEATLFGVKNFKVASSKTPPASTTAPANATPAFRPVLQYGPPNGVMPPQKPATPAPAPATLPTTPAIPATPSVPATPAKTTPTPVSAAGTPSILARPPPQAQAPIAASRPPPTASGTTPQPVTNATPTQSGSTPTRATPAANPPSAGRASGPVIVVLAERATSEPFLREVMRKVAEGTASPGELSYFQNVIDQITLQHRQAAISADKLLVDGRSVKYFADEADVILGVILRSNPNQRGVDLRPPNGSDSLMVALVRDALDSSMTRTIIHRIATNAQQNNDVQQLKEKLDTLFSRIQATKMPALPTPPPPAPRPPVQPDITSGRARGSQPAKATPEISDVVFEFAGTAGDRYKFPRFSIVNPVKTKDDGTHELIASFLIVRKGSTSEYGGDPSLDYYQPITMRISSTSARTLEAITKVVAPENEVKRYMDDIFDNMTRGEYVLLAMRLPQPLKNNQLSVEDTSVDCRGVTPDLDVAVMNRPPEGVLWTKNAGTTNGTKVIASVEDGVLERERAFEYAKLVHSVAAKEGTEL